MESIWLAFDIGTTGTKAALIDGSGRTVRSAYRDYPTISAEGGIAEQNAGDWWHAVCESARELNAREATAIALTGQMQDVILLDSQGQPVRPVILYSDTRAHREADEVNARIGVDRLRQLTGNSQDAGSLLAKLLWLLRNEAAHLSNSAHLLLGAADAIAFKLTGTAGTDTTTASTTGLLDINTRTTLPPDILAEIGLADVNRLLPQVGPGGSLVGTLTADAAQVLGLQPGLPVYLGPGDAGATTLGVGSGEPGQVYAYVGTSGWVAFTSRAQVAQDTGVFTLAHPRADSTIYIAPLLTAGGNLDWVHDLFGVESHSDMIDEALSREPTQLLYLPYLNGERSPFSDPFARGAFIGLNARHTRADLCRAVLEGVIFAYRHALDTLIAEPVLRLNLTGGGTRSGRWCQLFADIIGIPVSVAADAENVGARGAVLAAQVLARANGNYALAGDFGTALKPDNTHSRHYERQYGLFRSAYPALKSIFAEMR